MPNITLVPFDARKSVGNPQLRGSHKMYVLDGAASALAQQETWQFSGTPETDDAVHAVLNGLAQDFVVAAGWDLADIVDAIAAYYTGAQSAVTVVSDGVDMLTLTAVEAGTPFGFQITITPADAGDLAVQKNVIQANVVGDLNTVGHFGIDPVSHTGEIHFGTESISAAGDMQGIVGLALGGLPQKGSLHIHGTVNAGNNFSFDLNTFSISVNAPSGGTSTTRKAAVLLAIANAVIGSGEPVGALGSPTTVELASTTPGTGFEVSNLANTGPSTFEFHPVQPNITGDILRFISRKADAEGNVSPMPIAFIVGSHLASVLDENSLDMRGGEIRNAVMGSGVEGVPRLLYSTGPKTITISGGAGEAEVARFVLPGGSMGPNGQIYVFAQGKQGTAANGTIYVDIGTEALGYFYSDGGALAIQEFEGFFANGNDETVNMVTGIRGSEVEVRNAAGDGTITIPVRYPFDDGAIAEDTTQDMDIVVKIVGGDGDFALQSVFIALLPNHETY